LWDSQIKAVKTSTVVLVAAVKTRFPTETKPAARISHSMNMLSHIMRFEVLGTVTDRIPLWIVATLVAAALQVWRTALQQKLRGVLTPNGAGFVRYAFGAPWSVAAVGLIVLSGRSLPRPGLHFLWAVALGGVAQIIGTNFLIRAFGLRDFAIGTAYSKTEALQTALISVVFLGEVLPWRGWVGVLLSLAGVIVLAIKGDLGKVKTIASAAGDKAMWAGIAAGAGFAIAAVCIRSASKSLGTDQPVVRALMTLAVMNTIQLVVNGTWLGFANRSEFGAISQAWKSSALVGFLSVAGSAGWAIGMTLKEAAVVRTVGQIDLVFAFIIAKFFFKEQRQRSEYIGSALVVAGVALVLLR
jgi:drug/metabolite transporter (DMT)-like permease